MSYNMINIIDEKQGWIAKTNLVRLQKLCIDCIHQSVEKKKCNVDKGFCQKCFLPQAWIGGMNKPMARSNALESTFD